MRTLFGWLVLLALCCGAGYWQAEWTRGVKEERESLRAAPADLEGREASWGRLLIGRPSGAEPFELEHMPLDPQTADAQGRGLGSSLFGSEVHAAQIKGQDPGPLPESENFEYMVPKGRVLSKICEDFYGSGRSPIPERVASFNGLKSPDSLRAGVTLQLPPWAVLFPDGREHP